VRRKALSSRWISDRRSAFKLRAGPPPASADLVVVGAGVIGCATAFFATAAGLRTVVLDARPQPATLTTAAATGAYRHQHDNLEELATSSARPSRPGSTVSGGWWSGSTALA
jgi:glycine/D-amino acid oxidase-like deaminating enzyme